MGAVAVVVLFTLGAPPSSSVVSVLGPVDAVLLDRLRGHLSDLRWTIQRGPRSRDAAGRAPTAAATVRFERLETGGLRMRLSLPDGRRWRRELRGLEGPAAYEAAGLILRSALLAIDEGSTPGWLPEPPGAPSTATGSTTGWGWRAALRTEVNGVAPPLGLEVAAHRRWHHWSAGMSVSARWPLTVEESGTELSLGRYDGALYGGWSTRAGAWAFGARASAGAVLWHRTTTQAGPDAVARADAVQVGGVVTGAGWFARRLGGEWAITLEVGVDGLPGAPEWTLGDGTLVAAPLIVQPWLAVGVSADPQFRTER